MAQPGKNQPAMQETQETRVELMGWKDLLEKEMATLSSILAWKIPWQMSLAGSWGLRESDTTKQQCVYTHTHTYYSHWHSDKGMGIPLGYSFLLLTLSRRYILRFSFVSVFVFKSILWGFVCFLIYKLMGIKAIFISQTDWKIKWDNGC